jgi:hypothetical protein
LGDRSLDLLIGQSARLNLDFALVLECVDLLKELFSGRFFVLVNLVGLQSFCNLLLDLRKLDVSLFHDLLGHMFVVMLELSDAL